MAREQLRRRLNAALAIDPARTAVLAIDMHRGHLDPAVATMPVSPELAERVVGASARALRCTRAAGIPTVFLVMHNRTVAGRSEAVRNPFWRAVEELGERLTPDRESTIYGHNEPGSQQTEIIPELGPRDGDHVIETKHRLGSFYDTDLESLLRALRADTVLLMGINTNTCVQCTAFEAFNRDLAVVLLGDCVHSMYGDDLHSLGIENVARCLGWVISLAELEEKLGDGQAADGARGLGPPRQASARPVDVDRV